MYVNFIVMSLTATFFSYLFLEPILNSLLHHFHFALLSFTTTVVFIFA